MLPCGLHWERAQPVIENMHKYVIANGEGTAEQRALIVGFRDNTAVARMSVTGRQTWVHALEVRWLMVDWGKGGLDEMGEGAGDGGIIGEVVGSEVGVRKQEL